ncbi:MAG: hypothetical protein ACTSRZ_11955 [Promethearchaeota archaeon]
MTNSEFKMSDFFVVYRKKGFSATLEILRESKEKQMKEREFYKKLKDKKIPLNYFYRSKKDLLKYRLIKYNLDENFNMVIQLTDKGKKICDILAEIENLLKTTE